MCERERERKREKGREGKRENERVQIPTSEKIACYRYNTHVSRSNMLSKIAVSDDVTRKRVIKNIEVVGTGSESMSHDRSMKVCLPWAHTKSIENSISKSTTTQDLNSQI